MKFLGFLEEQVFFDLLEYPYDDFCAVVMMFVVMPLVLLREKMYLGVVAKENAILREKIKKRCEVEAKKRCEMACAG